MRVLKMFIVFNLEERKKHPAFIIKKMTGTSQEKEKTPRMV